MDKGINIDKLQQFLLILYKDFKETEVGKNSERLKEIAENGIASAIGAMELIKLNESKNK